LFVAEDSFNREPKKTVSGVIRIETASGHLTSVGRAGAAAEGRGATVVCIERDLVWFVFVDCVSKRDLLCGGFCLSREEEMVWDLKEAKIVEVRTLLCRERERNGRGAAAGEEEQRRGVSDFYSVVTDHGICQGVCQRYWC
jgi:hypothetical protein